ncbi:MAG: hypothetical protein DHS20C11_09930 [Lysobacteraceae bacterium]|nr:MAG: hypothetical protein DHS20C11_09930 [Xanthomonadaceae bacterium]
MLIGSNGPFQRYRFGTDTADFLLCSTCGVSLVALSHIEGGDYAVVNINCLKPPVPTEPPQDNDLDGEQLLSRLQRRAARWIANVSFGKEP